MARLINLTGRQIDSLRVLKFSHRHRQPCGASVAYWEVQCDCGKILKRRSTHLLTKRKEGKSCGCLRNKQSSIRNRTHGLKDHPSYKIWCGIQRRCNNPKDKFYHCYGGRGIKVDPRWDDVANFIEDMGVAPEGHSIDRINNDGPYSKDNCRWATSSEQSRNTRNTRFIEYNGNRKPLTDWAKDLKMPITTLFVRLKKMSLEAVIKQFVPEYFT